MHQLYLTELPVIPSTIPTVPLLEIKSLYIVLNPLKIFKIPSAAPYRAFHIYSNQMCNPIIETHV